MFQDKYFFAQLTAFLNRTQFNNYVRKYDGNRYCKLNKKYMYRHLIKRLFDIIIGLFALPFVLLFICILGPIIYFSDKGTIFYKAKRIGQICQISLKTFLIDIQQKVWPKRHIVCMNGYQESVENQISYIQFDGKQSKQSFMDCGFFSVLQFTRCIQND